MYDFMYDGTISTSKRVTSEFYLKVLEELEEKYKVGNLVNYDMIVNSLTLL